VREYLLTLLVTATVTFLLTPLVRRGAIRAKAMHEARDRDVHVVPIPLFGGLAMYGGLAAGLLVAAQIGPLRSVFTGDNRMAAGLLGAGGVLVIVGMIDDRWGLTPLSKLAGQVVAGVIVVWSGAQLSWLPAPQGRTLIPTPDEATVLTILVVVATINAVNFIDGLDGLAAGIVCIAAVSFFFYYYTLGRVVHLHEQAGPALASALLAGACLGFLPHNFYPARIFMGDTGAMLLGLLLAYVPISSIASLPPASLTTYSLGGTVNRFPEVLPLLLPAAILVIPYADMLLAVVRRTRAGQSPFTADRKHLHHRLLDIGHSHRSSVLIMYLWAALFSGTVVWLSIEKTRLIVFGVITIAAVLVLLLMSMPRLRWWDRHAPAIRRAGARSQAGAPVQAGARSQAGAPLQTGAPPRAGTSPGPALNGAAAEPTMPPVAAGPAAGHIAAEPTMPPVAPTAPATGIGAPGRSNGTAAPVPERRIHHGR
jgi:UDP-GlcNAc:undecaprenyl-phosphate GlcNAc-1-phosphate transferase